MTVAANTAHESKLNASLESLTLVELIKQDKDLLDFFRLVHQEDLREMAVSLLEKRINAAAN